MKKITKPAVREESVMYSDFSGKCFGEWNAPIELKIDFSYGSNYDGACLKLDLDDEDLKPILELIKSKLSKETKDHFKKQLDKYDKDYDDSMQMRDWDSCDRTINCSWLYRYFLDIKPEE
jgi:hypothetical protein